MNSFPALKLKKGHKGPCYKWIEDVARWSAANAPWRLKVELKLRMGQNWTSSDEAKLCMDAILRGVLGSPFEFQYLVRRHGPRRWGVLVVSNSKWTRSLQDLPAVHILLKEALLKGAGR